MTTWIRGHVLSETISQRHILHDLPYVESKKTELIETGDRLVVTAGRGWGELGEMGDGVRLGPQFS